ncbi:hypothetical protein RND71_043734 [Anisodus tanguticus]|uniref:Cwf19-like protein C-terminal domain-containing protein n=1 Tax=Anisodus tanguticus TaxID=243964 RepID=A0AAE1QPK2_9SOLA|nr:hypothetical protein RND71_043734 [Anisodus tanguticus]
MKNGVNVTSIKHATAQHIDYFNFFFYSTRKILTDIMKHTTFESVNGICFIDESLVNFVAKCLNQEAGIKNIFVLDGAEDSGFVDIESENDDALLQALVENGPISVPKGLPYFCVTFGQKNDGFAHVIENEHRFSKFFAEVTFITYNQFTYL